MTRQSKPRSGVTLGGIGTGGMELRQDGVFYNWSIFNNYPLGVGTPFTMAHDSLLFFVVRYQEHGKEPMMRLLQIEPEFGAAGIIDHPHYYCFPWLSGVDTATFDAVFPRVRMTFRDRAMPFEVRMEAWSPFIPHDVKHSSLPAVFFDFTIIPKTQKPVQVMLMASMRNAVAYDVENRTYRSAIIEGKGYKAFEMTCDGVVAQHGSLGTMGVASLSSSSSYYLGWEHRHPYYEIALRSARLPNIDDTSGRNSVDKETGVRKAMERCFSTIAFSKTLRGTRDRLQHTFAAVWHFPHRYGQALKERRGRVPAQPAAHIEGHYYSNFFDASRAVAAYAAAHAAMLRRRTNAFLDAFYASTVDTAVLDQINSHLNTFVTSSWITKDGNFGVIEGIDPHHSYAGLGTMDVAMYGGVCAAALFPELDRAMLRAHKGFQSERGTVAHSITRNFKEILPRELEGKRIDMPAQYAYMTLRAFFWSGDMTFLNDMWPSVKKALDYVLRERDMNGDCLPDMEGIMCSYDNFPMYGASSYVGSQFLAAVASAADVAQMLGETDTAARYQDVLARGTRAFEDKLWNGRYYRLYNDEGGARGDKDDGCMADQLIGQWAAHLSGLPTLFDPRRVQAALRFIMAHNYHAHYGVRNCRWPGDAFLHDVDKDTWVDQANTAWTGVELGVASFLIYEGLWREGLRLVKNVDDRYRQWGMYWDHQEFGGHYFRPMSAWSIVNALLGLAIKNGSFTFAPKIPGKTLRLFFSYGNGTAMYARSIHGREETITITALSGVFAPTALHLATHIRHPRAVKVRAGARTVAARNIQWDSKDGMVCLAFGTSLTVKENTALTVTLS